MFPFDDVIMGSVGVRYHAPTSPILQQNLILKRMFVLYVTKYLHFIEWVPGPRSNQWRLIYPTQQCLMKQKFNHRISASKLITHRCAVSFHELQDFSAFVLRFAAINHILTSLSQKVMFLLHFTHFFFHQFLSKVDKISHPPSVSNVAQHLSRSERDGDPSFVYLHERTCAFDLFR